MQISFVIVTLSFTVIDFLGLGCIVASPAEASIVFHLPLSVGLEMQAKSRNLQDKVCVHVCAFICRAAHTNSDGYTSTLVKQDNKLIMEYPELQGTTRIIQSSCWPCTGHLKAQPVPEDVFQHSWSCGSPGCAHSLLLLQPRHRSRDRGL